MPACADRITDCIDQFENLFANENHSEYLRILRIDKSEQKNNAAFKKAHAAYKKVFGDEGVL